MLLKIAYKIIAIILQEGLWSIAEGIDSMRVNAVLDQAEVVAMVFTVNMALEKQREHMSHC